MIPGSASPLLLISADSDFAIKRSLRFNSADSAYLNRTPSAAGNRRTWTWSGWVKRSTVDSTTYVWGVYYGNQTRYLLCRFNGSEKLDIFGGDYSTGSSTTQNFRFVTTAVYRDPAAWYHLVFAYDTTQATESDRFKIYVNGELITAYDTSSYPGLNSETYVNSTSNHFVGAYTTTDTFDGYLADVQLIDGQALAATDFGETDDNGVWQPKKFAGDYTLPAGQNYSDNNQVTGSSGLTNVEKMFDGLATTTDKATVGLSSDNFILWTPTSPVSYSSSVEVYTYATSGYSITNYYSFNGGTETTFGAAANGFLWTTVATGSGSISSIKIRLTRSGSASAVGWSAIRVDGVILTNQEAQGTNSFHLDFADNSSDAALGTDTSGVSPANTWTVNNLTASELQGQIYSQATGTATSAFSSTNFVGNFPSDGSGNRIYDVKLNTSVSTVTFGYQYGFNGVEILVSNDGTNWTSKGVQGATYTTISDSNPFQYVRWYIAASWVFGITNNPANTDSLVDTPTNGDTVSDTGAGGEITGNYATFNPLLKRDSNITYSQGNLQITSATTYRSACSTINLDGGKWYIEATCTTISDNLYNFVGVVTRPEVISYPGSNSGDDGFGYYAGNGVVSVNTATQATYSTWTTGDVIGLAYDSATRKCWVSKNGTWQNSGDPANGTGSVHTVSGTKDVFYAVAAGTNGVMTANFGSRPFAYAAPSGYKALNTSSLPTPTIADGSQYFDTKLYTGNGGTQSITGYNFSPDFVWLKSRNQAYNHYFYDQIRGVAQTLQPNSTGAETNQSTTLTSFNSDGFSLGDRTGVNSNNNTFVGWAWDAGSSTVSNTDGTVTSQVRASAASGFSIVSWTGTVNATVGHGLNTAPKLVITKRRAATTSWRPWSSEFSDIARNYLGFTSAAPGTFGSAYWGSMTSTTIGLKGLLDNNNGDMIAYCFAPVEGYSAISSYQGNGNASGPFVYTGFKPAFILLKNISNAASWRIHDSARDSFNVSATGLAPDTSSADAVSSTNIIDFLSNGFKLRGTGGSTNSSGNTYIYLAFASNPFASNGGLAR